MSPALPQAPNAPVHAARHALAGIAERRAAGEALRAQAMLELDRWIPRARAAGITVTEIAKIAGVSRQAIHDRSA